MMCGEFIFKFVLSCSFAEIVCFQSHLGTNIDFGRSEIYYEITEKNKNRHSEQNCGYCNLIGKQSVLPKGVGT